jgi:hypothetical protein
MNAHNITIAGYVLVIAVAAGLQRLAYGGRSRIPAFGDLLSRIMHTRSVRVGVVAGWAWVGLHFFAR